MKKLLKAIQAYFKGARNELRKVVWPPFPTLIRYLLSVVIGVAIATVFVGAVDYIFFKGLGLIIK